MQTMLGEKLRLISVRDQRLCAVPMDGLASGPVLKTGLARLDELMPRGGLAGGAVHELIGERRAGPPRFVAGLFAAAAAGRGAIAWCEAGGGIYPPAVTAMGLPLERFFLVQPGNAADEVWAIAECLRCKGVGAVVALPGRLSRIEARRLQLAAETGGGIGILLRPDGASAAHYAAATRWRVSPAPGTADAQRWEVQLVHGHGGRIGQGVILEVCRDTNHVRAIDRLADRSDSAQTARATA